VIGKGNLEEPKEILFYTPFDHDTNENILTLFYYYKTQSSQKKGFGCFILSSHNILPIHSKNMTILHHAL
jgi:hypothetical protein